MTLDRQKRDDAPQGATSDQAAAPRVGKATAVEAPSESNVESREGGKGEAAGSPPAPGAPGASGTSGAAPGRPGAGAGALGKITVSGKSKGASEEISKVAVGEKVTFTGPEEGTWTIEGSDAGTGKSIEWTAPDKAGGRIVRFEPFLTSPNTGKSTSTIVLVVAPTGVEFKKLGDVPSAGPGMAGVGMFLEVTVKPGDVSFEDVEWLERPGPAENVSGYFAAYVATGQSLAHVANTNWLPMGADNKGIVDRAYSRDKPKLMHPTEKTERWWAGGFSWTIPNVYRVKGFASEHLFASVVQSFTMNDEGMMTVTKGAASASAKPGGDVQGDLEKFSNVGAAKTYLSRFGRAGAIQAAMDYKRVPKADPASVGFLTQALNEFDILLRVELTCKNTFSMTDPDQVTVTANGVAADGGTKKLNDNKDDNFGSFEFHLNKVLDLKKLDAAPINLEADMQSLVSHKQSLTIAYPYAKATGTWHGDRYEYEVKIK